MLLEMCYCIRYISHLLWASHTSLPCVYVTANDFCVVHKVLYPTQCLSTNYHILMLYIKCSLYKVLLTIDAGRFLPLVGSLALVTDLTSPPPYALHSLRALDGDRNRFNIEPDANFSIECVFESPGTFSLSAVRDGTPLGNDDGVNEMTTSTQGPTTVRRTLRITFASFSSAMNGVYQCSATSSLTTVTSRMVLLVTGQ